MLEINTYLYTWPEDIVPHAYETSEQETFEEWWAQHGARLRDLEPRVAEQWIYKHAKHSPYRCLDIFSLASRLERWDTQKILTEVWPRDSLPAQEAYENFNIAGPNRTARDFIDNDGTWGYPIVVLETPEGFNEDRREYPDARYMLVEGHKRRRYLSALAARGECQASHEVFVLSQKQRAP